MTCRADQMLLDEVADEFAEDGFRLRERDSLLRSIHKEHRLTQADRASLVRKASGRAGPSARSADVNRELAAIVGEVFKPLSTEEVFSRAVALSPCQRFAVLPLDERTFYCYVGTALSPSVSGVFLWENYHKRNPSERFVSVFRDMRDVMRPWWPEPCRRVIFQAGGGLRIAGQWRSFGLTAATAEALVALFPSVSRGLRDVVLPAHWVRCVE